MVGFNGDTVNVHGQDVLVGDFPTSGLVNLDFEDSKRRESSSLVEAARERVKVAVAAGSISLGRGQIAVESLDGQVLIGNTTVTNWSPAERNVSY